MQPSVGRIVHYLVPNKEGNNGSDVAPAVITRVWSDTCVNLHVLLDGTATKWQTSVLLYPDRDALEAACRKRAEDMGVEPWYSGAFWPPRV